MIPALISSRRTTVETLKTALVIVVLGGVGYAVYIALNKNPDAPPEAPKPWVAPTGQPPGATPIGQNPASAKPRAELSGKNSAPTQLLPQGAGGMTPPAAPTNISPPSASIDRQAAAAPTGGPGVAPAASGAARDPFAPAADARTTEATPAAERPASGPSPFAAAWKAAQAQLNDGQLAEAHLNLSLWYDDPRTTEAERRQLNDLLDQLAGTVIYSTQHLLEQPYVVRPGERLQTIADDCRVPWQLLAKINGIDDPNRIQPGDQLKVLKGPFSAVVCIDKQELTLLLNGRYAGRFPIGIGRDAPLPEGHYTVKNKDTKPRYYGPGGQVMEADDPANPLGGRFIGLGGQLGIHGTNDPRAIGRNDLHGCVSLSPKDIEDVYDILSENSKVTIRR
jgi:LysM repeat protein